MNKYLTLIAVLFVSGVLLSACSPRPVADTVESIGGSADFFKITTSQFTESWVRPTDCRANIAKVLCEVEPAEGWGSTLSRPCLGGEEQYIPYFEAIYDDLDGINQEMFCSLRRIFIERTFWATGYASQVYQRKEDGSVELLPGAVMGVRRSLLQVAPDFANWLSWKEQKNFVENDVEFKVPLKYPVYSTPKIDVSLLQYVIVHEFGHMLDFANKINNVKIVDESCMDRVETDEDFERECQVSVAPESWGAFSWQRHRQVLPHKNFPGRDKLCFYDCQSYMSSAEMLEFYDGLRQSDFISSYGASNMMDDFAEAWAVRWMIERKDADLLLHADESSIVDTRVLYNSEKFREKREYMENFSKGEVLYP